MIRAVVFDIGGVLERVEDATWPKRLVARWERLAGRARGTIEDHLAAHSPPGSVVTGEITERDVRRLYAEALGLDETRADEFMRELWDAYCGELDQDMYDFAASLRPSYLTAILSNSGDGARREEQGRYGFEDLVDTVVYSHEVGLAKPDPAIYALTTQRLGVAPAEVLFVDDVPEYVDAARAFGWQAVLHRGSATSVLEMEAILEADEVTTTQP